MELVAVKEKLTLWRTLYNVHLKMVKWLRNITSKNLELDALCLQWTGHFDSAKVSPASHEWA